MIPPFPLLGVPPNTKSTITTSTRKPSAHMLCWFSLLEGPWALLSWFFRLFSVNPLAPTISLPSPMLVLWVPSGGTQRLPPVWALWPPSVCLWTTKSTSISWWKMLVWWAQGQALIYNRTSLLIISLSFRISGLW